MPQVPAASVEITTQEEARLYYQKHLAREHRLTCAGRPVTVYFEPGGTHLFSTELKGGMHAAIPVHRRIGRRIEIREFSLDRARLMDAVVPAIECFTVSIPGTGRHGLENRMLHGPRLPDGRYMRVVLSPRPATAFTCVSAYAVDHATWMDAVRARRAKFPP